MGKRTCPRCGAHDRSHEVIVNGREHAGPINRNTGIRVCKSCADELMDEIQAIFDTAREGIAAGVTAVLIREAEDERLEDQRLEEQAKP